jgi:hypothetical protein
MQGLSAEGPNEASGQPGVAGRRRQSVIEREEFWFETKNGELLILHFTFHILQECRERAMTIYKNFLL